MKTVKIILGVIIALSLVFFSIGIIKGEVVYTTEVKIEKPVEEVFEYFSDLQKMHEWIPEVQKVEAIHVDLAVVNSKYKVTIAQGKETVEMKQKITAYVPNEKMTFDFDSDQMLKTDAFTFVKDGDATIIKQTSSIRAKSYITSCLFPIFSGTFKEISHKYLMQLKDKLEK